jgi:WD40-like Beta Propeller Repeat
MASTRGRIAIFVALVGACIVIAVAAVRAGINQSSASSAVAAERLLADAATQPVLAFRDRGDAKGEVAIAPLRGARTPTPTGLKCDRVYFSDGRGLCLARGDGFAAGYQAKVFDQGFHVTHALDVAGVPSRARVSPDGKYGSVTLFVTGHSYADAGTFSTQTTLIDLARGEKVADLEDFSVTQDSRQVTAVDVNFWGVTFARDSDRFYATMATGGKTYLIEGSVASRTAHVLHENVECPSLSPDGRRIAYKSRTGSASVPWRLTVLDLRTMRETPLAETRSVDDQAEWLGNDRVFYGLAGAIWSVPANGTGAARRVARGDSPAVVGWPRPA